MLLQLPHSEAMGSAEYGRILAYAMSPEAVAAVKSQALRSS